MGKLEETFNLPETIDEISSKAEDIITHFDDEQTSELQTQIDEYNKKITNLTIEEVVDLETYDKEMDNISTKTLNEFEDLMLIGKDVEPRHSGEIFQAAAQMAKIALDASNNKMNAKIKMLELKLRKQRNDQIQQKQDAEIGDNQEDDTPNTGSSFSRDDLLDLIKTAQDDLDK